MNSFSRLKNVVQEYAWGSPTAIPDLLGHAGPRDKPQAELWMGAHPKAPSTVMDLSRPIRLNDLIEDQPRSILGDVVATRFGNRMPFLFKVLAADKPLSIQAHPSKKMAQEGYLRENRVGIPHDAPNRNYRDDQHKPELICALTNFWAMCGFRSFKDIMSRLRTCLGEHSAFKDSFRGFNHLNGAEGTRRLFEWLMVLPSDQREDLIRQVVQHARVCHESDEVGYWIRCLHEAYPNDIGVLSPILVYLIRLEPGQALFLPSGSLHAYLKGVGIELMANSDNVLRGGLTPKHVDVQELLKVLNFNERGPSILEPQRICRCETAYATSAEEFMLSVIQTDSHNDYESPVKRGIEILLCVEGEGEMRSSTNGGSLKVFRGTSIMVPASAPYYTISGNATLYRASVPLSN